MSPLVSIIIPVYNVAPYLRECLDSVVAQTFADWECICVDDGSTDDSGTILDEYAARDMRFRVIHQCNAGVSAARNAALDEAKGEWLSFLDADDWIEDKYLQLLIGTARRTSREIVMSSVNKVSATGGRDYLGPTEDRIVSPEELYVTYNALCAWSWGKLYRRQDWESIRFPKGISFSEDRYVLHEILYKYKTVAILQTALYNYRMRTDSAMGTNWHSGRLQQRFALERQIQFFKQHGFEKALLFTVGLYFKGIGRQLCQLKRQSASTMPLLEEVQSRLSALQQEYWGAFVKIQRRNRWREFPYLGDVRSILEEASSPNGLSHIRKAWNLFKYDGLPALLRREQKALCTKLSFGKQRLSGRGCGEQE